MEKHVVLKFNLKSGEDDQTLRTVQVGSDRPVIVGRSSRDTSKGMVSSSDNLHIANSVISRNHARITYESKAPEHEHWAVFVEDTNSSHGIFVNGIKAMPNVKQEIYDGDDVGFGVSIKRSDGPTHLSPVYNVNLANGTREKDCAPGRSWTMPVESDYDEFDEYDDFYQEGTDEVEAILADIYESEADEGAEENSSDDELESQDLVQEIPSSPRQPYHDDTSFEEEDLEDQDDATQARIEAPTSGQAVQAEESWGLSPITPKADRSLLTPEDEAVFDPRSAGVRTNSTFWDAVLEHPSAAPTETTSPRVLHIRDLLSAAPPQSCRKRKFQDELEELGENSTFDVCHAVIPETILSSPTAFACAEDDNDTTLVEDNNAAVARYLKEPSKTKTIPQSEVHHKKRSRLGDVVFGVGMFVAGSASAIAALATLPDGFFA